eukprot:6175345-Pleurochrysis_carterae.AAC.2
MAGDAIIPSENRLHGLPIYTGQLLGQNDKWSFSSAVRECTVETGAAAVGAAEGVEPAGVEPVAAAAVAGAEGNVTVGAMGDGESIEYGVYKLKNTA